MKKKHVIIASVVVLILVVVFVVAPYLVNADNYRPTVESTLSSSVGRRVTIGHLHFSLLNQSLTAEELSIADDPAFSHSPFVRAQSLQVGVDIWPLIFSHVLHIKTLTLDKPEVTLLRAPSGRWNYSSLSVQQKQTKTTRAAMAESGGITDVSIAALKINNGRLTLGNLAARGTSQSLNDVYLSADDLSETTPFSLKLTAKTLAGGTLKLAGTGGPLLQSGTIETMPVHLKIDGEKLPGQDVEAFLHVFGMTLPAGSSLRGGTVNGNLNAEGALDRLVTTGPVSVSKVTLSGFNIISKLAALTPTSGASGSSETVIQDMSSKVRSAPEGIHFDDLNIVIPILGTLTGAGTISPTNELNFHVVAKFNANTPFANLQKVLLGQAGGEGVPLRIRGTTSNPIFEPEFGGNLGKSLATSPQVGRIIQGLTGRKKPP